MLNTEIKERTQKMTKGDHAIYDGNDTYEVGGKTYKVEKYIDVPECGSVPLLNLKMMSDERWNELATQNAIENYIKEFGKEPESVDIAVEWQEEQVKEMLKRKGIEFPSVPRSPMNEAKD